MRPAPRLCLDWSNQWGIPSTSQPSLRWLEPTTLFFHLSWWQIEAVLLNLLHISGSDSGQQRSPLCIEGLPNVVLSVEMTRLCPCSLSHRRVSVQWVGSTQMPWALRKRLHHIQSFDSSHFCACGCLESQWWLQGGTVRFELFGRDKTTDCVDAEPRHLRHPLHTKCNRSPEPT